MKKNTKKITEDYISGFVDGEGCFFLTFRKDKKKYFYWKSGFAIVLRGDDVEILKNIKTYFGCGSISFTKNFVRYQISNNDELTKIIIPFFEKFNLIGKKGSDFELWRRAVLIINRNKRKEVNAVSGKKGFAYNDWNKKDLNELVIIRNKMLEYKSGSKVRKFKY